MSQGKLMNDCIQCPYHGWEFNSEGKLTKVPSSNTIPKQSDITKYCVQELGGFVWNLDSIPSTIPTDYCPELYSKEWIKVYGSKELDGNIIDWILNGTDISHINYVHDFADENKGNVTETTRINDGPNKTTTGDYTTANHP
jgi:phenylpropionate dioxygenase-like ring-hydroxylating dioxygenase large terminal subunit